MVLTDELLKKKKNPTWATLILQRDARVCTPQEVRVKLTASGPCFKKPPETC